jgi:DnaJ-class molecular chaperone
MSEGHEHVPLGEWPLFMQRTPHKCPVCDGSGLVNRPPWVAGDQQVFWTSSCGPWQCNACGGSGVLWR